MLSTVCPRLGGRTQVLAPCERLGDPAREFRYRRTDEIQAAQSNIRFPPIAEIQTGTLRSFPNVCIFVLNLFKSAENQIGPRIDECACALGHCRAGLYRAQRVVRPQGAPRFLPVRRPMWPVEFRHGGDFATRVSYSRGCGASEFER